MKYVKDSMGRFIGTVEVQGNREVVREFKSGKIVSTFDQQSNKTIDWHNNKTLSDNQAIRFLK